MKTIISFCHHSYFISKNSFHCSTHIYWTWSTGISRWSTRGRHVPVVLIGRRIVPAIRSGWRWVPTILIWLCLKNEARMTTSWFQSIILTILIVGKHKWHWRRPGIPTVWFRSKWSTRYFIAAAFSRSVVTWSKTTSIAPDWHVCL